MRWRFQHGCSNNTGKSTTRRSQLEQPCMNTSGIYLKCNSMTDWTKPEIEYGKESRDSDTYVIRQFVLVTAALITLPAIWPPLVDTTTRNIHKWILGVPFNSLKDACHLNYLDNEKPHMLTAPTLRFDLNRELGAVPTAHAQSMMNLCKPLPFICENSQETNFSDLELLQVRHVTTRRRNCLETLSRR